MIIILIILGSLLNWFLCAGWAFAESKHRYGLGNRDDLGAAIMIGFVSALIGPLGTLMAFCFTGFAEHGWTLKLKSAK